MADILVPVVLIAFFALATLLVNACDLIVEVLARHPGMLVTQQQLLREV